jgi:uncharacterized Zn finger protein
MMPVAKAPGAKRARPSPAAIRSATMSCEVCGTETPHRILRVAAASAGGVEGIARCNTCRWTHPFKETAPVLREVWVIRSDGPSSVRVRTSLPPGTEVRLHEPFPGSDPPTIVRRIEAPDGKLKRVALPSEIATVWTVLDRRSEVPVSLILGRITRRSLWSPPPGSVITVGERLNVDGSPTFIVGFRARARTWRRPGDSMAAEEVTRIYARITDNPPAGSSGWSTERDTPSSLESSTSRPARSRSGPGRRIARIVPRIRRARGGATVQ